MSFAGKIALVTGGNSGIGLATAKLLIAQGARVVITGRDRVKLDNAAAELGELAIAVQADFDDLSAIENVVEVVREIGGTLDILFANAGISGPTPLGTTSRATFEAILRTNVTEVFFTVQELVPFMGRGSSIVLNGSVTREIGRPGSAAYAASKAAISGMARALAGELAPRGIRVNTVIPGATRTPIWTRGARQGIPMEQSEKAQSMAIPIDRMIEPEEIARAVLFLASDASSGMTAAEIVVDGGTIGAAAGAPVYR